MSESAIKHARILIIDDEVSNTCLLESVLSRTGFTNYSTLHDSRQALDRIIEFEPDLVLLDLNMPHVSGLDVMQQLRLIIAPEIYLPVLVLTADTSPKAKRRALAAGATDFLLKPFDTNEALMRIRNLIRTRLLHLELQNHNTLLELKVSERTRELSDALAELKQTQNQIVQQERLKAFGEMAGGIVHDFNNALMSVIGYSDLLLLDPETLNDRETTLDYLRTLNTAGRDAAQVVSRLREFYRDREIEDVFSSLDLNEIIRQSASLTQPKWKTQALAAGREISLELDLEKVPTISGDASELREVATNLIFNAVDAMPAGGTLTLRSRRDGDRVVFEISDTGTGMTETVRNSCLEPFFSTKGDQGTGLGLSMVFGIVKRHNGMLAIETAEGQGTTFKISLPAEVATAAAAVADVTKPQRSLQVLLVDDDAVPRDVLTKYLLADGHAVVTATDGVQALQKWTQQHFDLLVTDFAMTRMNGVELCASLKKMGTAQPLILTTGSVDQDLNIEGQSAVDLVLRKPVTQLALRHALNQVAQLSASAA
jgi:signal transduction histidine kinase